jgi:exopolysaccharide production protein ExoZ
MPLQHSPFLRFEGIQALRFVAALLVVVTHATFYVSERLIQGYPVWASGAAGVDVFFVISGFVMVVSSRGLIGRSDAARTFLLRRVSRVVPLYWVATTLKVAVVIAAPAAVLNSGLDIGHIVKSYLFLPSYNESGQLQPVVGVGWTLNFEMFFYVMFAAALALRISPTRFVTILFGGLSILALFRQPGWPAFAFWFDTIVLEFVAGMYIAHWCMAGVRVPPVAAGALATAGFVGLLWPWGVVPDMMRVLTWGIPAMMIVAGVALLEPVLQGRVPAPLISLGDSSYALYLFHPMIAPIAPALLAKAAMPNAPLSIVLSITVSIVAAIAVYRFGERPMTDFLKGFVNRSSRPVTV